MYNYGYNYGRTSYRGSGMEDMMVVFILLVTAVLSIMYLVAWCKMFTKAGLPWERIFVPFYGAYWTYQIAECGYIYWINIVGSVLALILEAVIGTGIITILWAIVSIVLGFVYSFRLAEMFGRGKAFGVGLALLPPIFVLILGLGDDAYYGDPQGMLGDSTDCDTWTCTCGALNPYDRPFCSVCSAHKPAKTVAKGRRHVARIWICTCGAEVPASHLHCDSCGASKPRGGNSGVTSTEVSRWTCTCGAKNSFAKSVCPQCGAARPADAASRMYK